MTETQPQGEPDATCPVCGKPCRSEELVPHPDPFNEEINDDQTPVIQCDECRYESQMNI